MKLCVEKRCILEKKHICVLQRDIHTISCEYLLCFYFNYRFSNSLICLRHIKQMHERSISETDPRHPLLIVLLIIATKMCSEHDADGFPGSFFPLAQPVLLQQKLSLCVYDVMCWFPPLLTNCHHKCDTLASLGMKGEPVLH
jgi:hypothetical protein